MGEGGNTIYFDNKKKIVVAIASIFKHNVKDRIKFINKYIKPILDN